MSRAISLILIQFLFILPAHAGKQSEEAAASILLERLENQDPEALGILKAVRNKDIVVVRGSMDQIENILSAASIPHSVVSPEQVAQLSLRGDQIVMVNCPGTMPEASIKRIEQFVRAGGLLYTTDWALKNLIEKAFPQTISHNGKSTGNQVIPVQVHKHDDNLMSDILLRKSNDPHWFLEGGSYPILIHDLKKVDVLASSRTLQESYGAAPVVVRFPWEDGEIIHVVSHFYRQLDTDYTTTSAAEAIDSVSGLTDTQKSNFKTSTDSEVNMGDLESSYAFQKMTTNLITTKSKKNEEWRQKYRWTLKEKFEDRKQTLEPGKRIKILQKNKDQATIRDEEGREFTIQTNQLVDFETFEEENSDPESEP